MLRPWRGALRGRPWVAVAAAYAIAIQALLTGIAGAHLATRADLSDQAFVVCHGSDGIPGSGEDDGSGKSGVDHASCALCTLARAAPAILPISHGITPPVAFVVATTVAPIPVEVVDYNLSAGHSPRGPPIAVGSVG